MAEKKQKKGGNVVETVWALAQPLAESLGLSLWDVRFVKDGAEWYLRIFIDREEGVSIDDCVNMTHLIDGPLDELDPIPQAYCLEVSSPGINRQLIRPLHFAAFLGAPVKVKLIRPLEDGTRVVEGELADYSEDDKITVILPDDREMIVDKKETSGVFLNDEDFSDEEE